MNKEFSTFADGSDCKECAALERNVEALKQRLAAAEAAARFYAKYYDGPAEALLCEEDRRAFMWIEENGGEP